MHARAGRPRSAATVYSASRSPGEVAGATTTTLVAAAHTLSGTGSGGCPSRARRRRGSRPPRRAGRARCRRSTGPARGRRLLAATTRSSWPAGADGHARCVDPQRSARVLARPFGERGGVAALGVAADRESSAVRAAGEQDRAAGWCQASSEQYCGRGCAGAATGRHDDDPRRCRRSGGGERRGHRCGLAAGRVIWWPGGEPPCPAGLPRGAPFGSVARRSRSGRPGRHARAATARARPAGPQRVCPAPL